MNGAELMTKVLKQAGIDVVGGIPGHTVLGLANAIGRADGITPMLFRHEATATFAADVYFRLSGRLMAVFTHAFPGLTNGLVGISNAYADSSAMLVISGQTARASLGRGAYQEFSRQFDGDTAQLLRHSVKRVYQPHGAADLVDKTWSAIRLARSGRPGPTAIDVFEEIWDEEVVVDDFPPIEQYVFDTRTRPSQELIDRAHSLLLTAKRPVIVCGHGALLSRSLDLIRQYAEVMGIPVATTGAGKGAFPETHPLSLGTVGWVGTSVANWATRNADVILCLGARLSETTSSSWQPGITFEPSTKIVQVDIEDQSLAQAYPIEVGMVGDIGLVIQDLLQLTAENDPAPAHDVGDWLSRIDDEKVAWREVVKQSREPGSSGRIGLGYVVESLEKEFRDVPINLVCDVGKHHKWIMQQYTARDIDRVVNSVAGGAMGIGAAGALGAVMGRPDARTISWNGDGGMSMMLPAWLTAAEYQFPIIFLVANDQSYGAVANIQQAHYGNTVYSEFDAGGARETAYQFDASAVASAAGIPSMLVDQPGQVPSALAWAANESGPAVLDIRCDRHSVVPSGGGKYIHDYWNHRTLPPGVTSGKVE